jgi:CubicO group peptidase (beta-lactamase class C family)
LHDLARVGELWRQGGVFQRERLLPEQFVAAALSDQSRPDDSFFGYGWFLRDPRREKSFPEDLFYQVSLGPDGTSTLLAVIPGWQMVAAVGADARKWDFTKDADIPPPAIAKFWMGELPKVMARPAP